MAHFIPQRCDVARRRYSLGKMPLAIITLGISLIFGVGVSRKRKVVTFRCKNCRNEWTA